jgi:hypothetical protein
MVAPALSGPRLLASGEQAARIVARVLPLSRPIRVSGGAMGDVELRPGTVWSGDRMLVSASTMAVDYTIGNCLYEWGTGSFIRDEWLNALSRGAARAMPMVYYAQVEVAFLTALFVPWQIVLGMFVAKTAFFYYRNKELVQRAARNSPKVMHLIMAFHRRCPTLFNKLCLSAGKNILVNFPRGVTAEDVAYFLGRVLGNYGIAGLPEVTLVPVLKVIGEYLLFVSALHLPSVTAHWVAADLRKDAGNLKARLAAAGVHVDEAEAAKILHELQANPDTEKVLKDLETAGKDFIPIADQLTRLLRAGS